FREVLGIPVPVLIFAIASIILAFVLGATILGRQVYQIGTSEIAARHAGIKVRAIKFGLFIAMGVVSALCGLIATSRLASVRYDLAQGGELQMVLIVIIATGMTVANIPITTQLTVMGLLLVVSIIATNLIYSRNQR